MSCARSDVKSRMRLPMLVSRQGNALIQHWLDTIFTDSSR